MSHPNGVRFRNQNLVAGVEALIATSLQNQKSNIKSNARVFNTHVAFRCSRKEVGEIASFRFAPVAMTQYYL
jgi:hypothetical protein